MPKDAGVGWANLPHTSLVRLGIVHFAFLHINEPGYGAGRVGPIRSGQVGVRVGSGLGSTLAKT